MRARKPRIKAAGLVVAAISRFKAELQEQANGFFAPSQWEPQVRYPADCGPSEETFLFHYLKSATVSVDYPAVQGYTAGIIAQRCIEQAGSLNQSALREAASRLRCTTLYGPYAIEPKTGRRPPIPCLSPSGSTVAKKSSGRRRWLRRSRSIQARFGRSSPHC